jgi:hypothetical protein
MTVYFLFIIGRFHRKLSPSRKISPFKAPDVGGTGQFYGRGREMIPDL